MNHTYTLAKLLPLDLGKICLVGFLPDYLENLTPDDKGRMEKGRVARRNKGKGEKKGNKKGDEGKKGDDSDSKGKLPGKKGKGKDSKDPAKKGEEKRSRSRDRAGN